MMVFVKEEEALLVKANADESKVLWPRAASSEKQSLTKCKKVYFSTRKYEEVK